MRLRSSLTEVKLLTSSDRQQMYSLMQCCYANVRREKFEKDLDAKWLVIKVHDPQDDQLVGFSTQVMLEAIVDRKPIHALFSGDTVVKPSHWGDSALAHEWGQLALRLIDQHPAESLYWFLTSKGFRTYKYLPLFFQHYSPKVDEEIIDEHAAVIDALGQLVGGCQYDQSRRIILSGASKDFVRSEVSNPIARKRWDPHVRLFLELNPGYSVGEELCCLAPLSRQNFTRAAYRMINAHTAEREAI